MNIQLSEHFTYQKLLRFVFPSIIMMIFTSIYGVVDGLFVSNFAGKTPFAAINLIMPFLMIFGTLGFMIGTGGSAIISKTLGEKREALACEYFSMLIYTTIISGIILTVLGILLLRPVALAFGASGEMLSYCVLYGSIIMPVLTFFMLQNVFQSFLITAEKPHFGLAVTVAAGCTNIVLDALFVAAFEWGLVGAAVATAISQIVGGLIPLLYFMKAGNSRLHLVKTRINIRILLKTCTNGSSELMSNVSMSIVNMLYNYQLMRFAGADGVAAYGVIMYVNFIFIAVFIGYSIGCAPIIGYHYGAGNHPELKNMLKKSLFIIAIFACVLTASAELMAAPLSHIFVGYDPALTAMTKYAFQIYSISFLLSGFNIFGSAFFTALNNGIVSAGISFTRTLIFQVAAVLLLPLLFGLSGIWMAIVVAEVAALVITIICLIRMNKKYQYF